MEITEVRQREREEQASRLCHSMQLSSQTKKKTFTSSDEEASYSDFYPIISADVMSVKEVLNMDTPRHRTWEDMENTLLEEESSYIDKWTMFGNEAESVELDVIRNQRALRCRADRGALRRQAERKALYSVRYLELRSQRAPWFSVPLRAHCVWEGMSVTLACSVQGCPPPEVTWYKDGVALSLSGWPWNHHLQQAFGLHKLQIRRCTSDDAGEYKVTAQNLLGEAVTFGTLLVNSYLGAVAGSMSSQSSVLVLEQEARFETVFPPSWVKEGEELILRCSFSAPLLPFQTDVAWFQDGVQLHPSSSLEVMSSGISSSISIKKMHKEYEGVYTVRLKTQDGLEEHRAFVHVQDASAAVLGGPASPLALQVSDVNRDYVFLSWEPPSADGDTPVQGYYVERSEAAEVGWVRCNDDLQKACHLPVFGLRGGALYRFRVCAVNRAGAGRWSKPSDPVLTSDPLEPSRTIVVMADRGRQIIITKDQLEGEVRVPLPPTSVTACEVSSTYVVLSWTEPDPRGREALTFYVERSLAGRESWEMASLDMVVASPRFPVLDLIPGRKYRFRVRSVNTYGISNPSQPSAPISLGPAQAVPGPAHSLLAFRDSDSSVFLRWQEPSGSEPVLGYYLYYSQAGTQDWNAINNKPISDTRFTVHGLQAQKEYVFRIKSVGRAGNSKYSQESSPIRVIAAIWVPSAPSHVALLMCTGSGMVLSWRAPACDGGCDVSGYFLDKTEKDQEAWREVNHKPAQRRLYKVCGLTAGVYYQFRVFAANVVGLGGPSGASEAFLCEEWTMAEPGCPYDLEVREVRSDSLLLLWETPLYQGQSPLIGYQLQMSQGNQSDSWNVLNDEPITDTFYKVSGLQSGQTYRFRVSAVNQAGVGGASLPSEPITAQTQPGTREVEVGVDEDGFIFLSYEVPAASDRSNFLWSKNHRQAVDAGRATTESKHNRSVLTFSEACEDDLGLYSVELSDMPSLSSSYTFTTTDLERLKELSWQIRHPRVALRSDWQVEVKQDGVVRLWLQTEALSDSADLRLILNNKEIGSTARRRVTLDRASGLVEVLLDQLGGEDQGSYTIQIRDGRAENQFTLVFVEREFRETMVLAQTNRHNLQRMSGPYFLEHLSWVVTEACELIISCKVCNLKEGSTLKWFKDGREVTQTTYHASSGVSTLTIPQVTSKEAGSYRAQVADGRGQDVSTLELVDEEFDKLLQQLSKRCALSAGPLRVQCTCEGLRLCCTLTYYLSTLRTSWMCGERRMDRDTRTQSGSSMDMVWMDISNPTEADRGKYTLEMFDGQETHGRHLDLSGQALSDALLEYMQLKQAALAERKRAKVTKGLPDVVAIMEGKSLCLTCFVDGDPAPEVSWLRNDREISDHAAFSISREPTRSALTVDHVSMEDSGKYSILVRNQHGSDTVHVTLSVYRPGETPPAHAVQMG